jgi:hypothetical protein
MESINNGVKSVFLVWAAIGLSAGAAEYTVDAGGKWETSGSWDTGTVPASLDQIIISGSSAGKTVTMDADSWQYLQDNGLQYSASEYRTYKLGLAETGAATLNVDIGDGNTWKATEAGTYYVGSSSGSAGTLNVISGDVVLEASSLQVGQYAGSVGAIHVTGANAYFSAARASGETSMLLGAGGTGTFYIEGGTFETRMGVTVGASGTFEVAGSGVASIGIGSRSSLDGNWVQNSGGTLNIGIDSGGVTPIFVDDVDDDGAGGDVFFESGALLDVHFLEDAENGSWDVMQWEGTLTNNGLGFASNVDANAWSLSWVDTDATNGVDTLRVTYSSAFYTTNGTPYAWLDDSYPGLTSVADYQLVDDVDSDNDGLLTWEEYVAGTDPTNTASVLAMQAIEITNNQAILSWASVSGKRYGIKRCTDLLDPLWEDWATHLAGRGAETAVTSTVSRVSNAFFKVFIETMPDVLELEAEADAFVRDGTYADLNFGTSAELKTLNADDTQSELLLRFDLPSTTETPDAAFIWIQTTGSGTDPVENAAYRVAENSWAEDAVTWNTMPEAGDELDAWVTTNNRAIKIDVTDEIADALQAGGLFSIAIKSPHNMGDDGASIYASRENLEWATPKLEIRFNQPTVTVEPGESIQAALDAIHAQGGGIVDLAAGEHMVTESLVLYSDITLSGQGADRTTLLLDEASNEAILVGTSEGSVNSDITIRDLKLDGQQASDEQHYVGTTDRDTVRGDSFGMLLTDQESGNTFERMRIENVAVTRCAMGIHIKGVDDLRILNSEIAGNGCLIGYDHNIYFRRAENTLLKNLNISDCTAGNGFNLSTDCHNLIIDHCDASDNNFRGIRFEANDGGSRMMIINCITSRNGLTEGQPGIRVANVPDFTIIGTTSNDNGDNGFYCPNSEDGLLRDNSASGNADSNYYLPGSTYEQSNNTGW